MDDLEKVEQDAGETAPSTESDTEMEYSDDELRDEIDRLKEEAKTELDPKQKRHMEQEAGWKQKILREREKAKTLEAENVKRQESITSAENTLVEEAFSKTIDENFGLPYFEKLAKTNPKIADRVAREKWGVKNARELIIETKRNLANNGDEESRTDVTREEAKAEARHEVALELAESIFDDLDGQDRIDAKEYFDDMVEGKLLDIKRAKRFAEIAKSYVLKDKPIPADKIDKDRILASKASTKLGTKSTEAPKASIDIDTIRQQLLNAGINRHMVDQMYPVK